MKKFFILTLLTFLFIIGLPNLSLSQTPIPNSVTKNAREVSIALVQILSDGKPTAAGSGVIIAKEDNQYDVLTVAHNLYLDEPDVNTNTLLAKLRINTYDEQLYTIDNYERVKHPQLGNLDLAIIHFRSNRNYATGKFLNSQQPIPQNLIYVAGFPQTSEGFRIDSGRFLEFIEPLVSSDNEDVFHIEKKNELYIKGYNMRYKASQTGGMASGMSGGGIFNAQGQIIGIHGRQELWQDNIKLGTGMNIFWESSISNDQRNRIQNSHTIIMANRHLQ
jgi:S1-C subfamily serine protease